MNARSLVCLAALFAPTTTPYAATSCVTNSSELQSALSGADNNGQSDEIRLAAGIYEVPSLFGFSYDGNDAGDDNLALTLSGGWTELSGNPCGQQLATTSAFDTVIDGDNRFRALVIRTKPNSDITVRKLWFTNGRTHPGDISPNGGGLLISPGVPNTATFLIENCAFTANQADTGSALYVADGAEIRVRNSLFAANHALSSGTVSLSAFVPGLYFTNNTVISNTTANLASHAGASLLALSGGQFFVANNIFWGNDHKDVRAFNNPGPDSYFLNNDYQLGETSASVQAGNLSVTPQYEGGFLDLLPAEGSPLINAGVRPPSFVPVPPPFHQAWSTGVLDLKGNSRVRGGEIDIGAYEARGPLLSNGFE